MLIALIDYGSGNLRSAAKAFERVIHECCLNAQVLVTADAADLARASHIVLPGVGAFGQCAAALRSLPGMTQALERQVREKQKPFLGICVGMQLMMERGFEHGEHAGLGWIEGEVVKLDFLPLQGGGSRRGSSLESRAHLANVLTPTPSLPLAGGGGLKIPHMGWNELTVTQPSPLLEHIADGDHAYFVHSYHARCKNPGDVLAEVEYGGRVAAVIGRDTMFGTQFHPEKSQSLGLRLLENFLRMK